MNKLLQLVERQIAEAASQPLNTPECVIKLLDKHCKEMDEFFKQIEPSDDCLTIIAAEYEAERHIKSGGYLS